MRSLAGVGIVLLLACAAVRADDPDKKKTDTLKEQYDALQKEYAAAQQAFFEAIRKADPEEQGKVMDREAPKLEKVLARFVELADKNPKDPVAVDALSRVIEDSFAARAGGASRKKAVELIRRDHLASDKLGTLCQRLGGIGNDVKDTELLRAILDKNPAKAVQAEACLALMQGLGQRAEFARRMKEDEALAKRAEEFLGKEAADELRKADADKLDAEAEKLTKQFAEKYVGELKSERLANLCQRLSFSPGKSNEALLRKLAENDKDEVKGVATLCLAQMLKQSADQKADKDAKAAEALAKESEKLFERAAEKYADVKLPFRGTVGSKAKSELYELRNLRVGKPAPDVEGEDQDGKKFKLSDYKGKVVLLDFWSQF